MKNQMSYILLQIKHDFTIVALYIFYIYFLVNYLFKLNIEIRL